MEDKSKDELIEMIKEYKAKNKILKKFIKEDKEKIMQDEEEMMGKMHTYYNQVFGKYIYMFFTI